MLKANQDAVIQEANIQLVNIRYAEIQYFTDFFTNFGTQCFLLAGFICGAVSQTPGYDANCNYFWVFMYNIASAACVALATLGLLISVFISVFGQGLAIRGPPGSMIKAIEGMVIEQHNAVALFLGAVISYILQEIGMFWIMMDQPNAIICSIIVAVFAVYTYNVSLRIYNRFYFNKSETDFQIGEENGESFNNELNPNVNNDINRRFGGGKGPTTAKANTSAKKEQKSMFGKMVSKVKKTVGVNKEKPATSPVPQGDPNLPKFTNYADNPYYDGASVMSDTPYVDINDLDKSNKVAFAENEGNNALKYAGYLTVRSTGSMRLGDPWERKYFVIRENLVFYYKDKRSFDLDPSKPINTRPIDLEGYTLVAGSVEPPFAITLVPSDSEDIRKAWKFRCDTLAEFHNWVDIFAKALKACNKGSGEYVNDGILRPVCDKKLLRHPCCIRCHLLALRFHSSLRKCRIPCCLSLVGDVS